MYDLTLKPIPPENAGEYSCGRFLQSPLWAAFKSENTWQSVRFFCEARSQTAGGAQLFAFEVSVLLRDISRLTLAYIPLGIDFNPKNPPELSKSEYLSLLAEFAAAVKPYLPANTFCLRFDPPLEKETQSSTSIIKATKNPYVVFGFVKPLADIQPPDTVLLDLDLSEEQLLEQMKPKWRYNIRLAEKKSVTVRKGNSCDIDVFYDLYLETAKRDGIAIHAKNYYRNLCERSSKKTPVTLYIAEHEGDAIAAIVTLFTPFEAVYLYGASSNIKRNLMAAYLLQWTAIRDAKNFGSRNYDFYGIPPDDNETHPMHGLYRFKTGFGGTIVHRVGSLDYPLSFMYDMYAAAEKMRSFWYKKVKKLFVTHK